MSRITPHCACQNNNENIDQSSIPSKTYSILPNYFAKIENNQHIPDFCLNSQYNNSNKSKLFRSYECKVCQNYENIEHFISGTFRPHSCPNEDNDTCIRTSRNEYSRESRESPQISSEHPPQNEKYQRKCSKSSLKTEKSKFHDQIYMMKNTINGSTTQRLDTIHQGLNLYINNNGLPLLTPQDTRKSHSTFIAGENLKKPSCGLKYIIFQKLSIMTHFLTKSKTSSHNGKMNKKQLSEENLFNDNQCQTKRSKSFHTMDHKDGNFCDEHYSRKLSTRQNKHRSHKIKESDTSNSSTGSIDAHAGSPITTSCNNILGGRSFPIMTNQFVHKNNVPTSNDWKRDYMSPDIKEFSHRKNHNQTKPIDSPHIDAPEFCLSQHNCHCQNCLHYFQQSCQQMVLEQMCRSHCMSQSHCQSQLTNCHCCCLNHSHVFMHPPFPQSSSLYCNKSHVYCHCSNSTSNCFHGYHQENVCQFENRPRSTLCNSCLLKNNNRSQSETFDDNKRHSEQSNKYPFNHQSSNANIRYKLKSETKSKTFKPSTSSHSKSITSSIPPPPPPPPSSLYSTHDAIISKPKHRKHHNKTNKLCENCNVMIPQTAHSPDCTNNVQNIIYSHLNNTSSFCDPKIDQAILTTHPDIIRSFDDHIENTQKTIKYKSFKGQIGERSDKDDDKDNYQLSSSKRRGIGYGHQKELFERRSADMLKEEPMKYKPRFLSKTPETYKNKNDRRHKKHQYETQKMAKHKSISTTREYKFIDSDLFYREDSIDSPEAGSFIYHSISPMVQNNIQTVVPKKVSSFNNRQHYNYKDSNYAKTELIRKAFQENMLSLREVGWYWGPLSFTEAESLMENKANGTFLVRDSGHDTYFLSLTFRVREATYHTRIEYSQGTFSFWSQPESHSATTIVEFIDKAVAHSQSGKFHYFLLTNVPGQPPMEVSLLYPLSRHQIVHSLKHMSRFVILSHIRKDHVTELSVPPALRTYLLEKQYYISNLEEFIDMTMDAHPLSYKPSTFS